MHNISAVHFAIAWDPSPSSRLASEFVPHLLLFIPIINIFGNNKCMWPNFVQSKTSLFEKYMFIYAFN